MSEALEFAEQVASEALRQAECARCLPCNNKIGSLESLLKHATLDEIAAYLARGRSI